MVNGKAGTPPCNLPYPERLRLPFRIDLRDSPPLSCETLLRHLPGRRLVCAGRIEERRVLAKLFCGPRGERDARREHGSALALEQAGVPTPRLLGLLRGGGEGFPVLLYEYLDSATSLAEAWSRAGPAEREDLLRRLLEMMARQHAAGLLQQDLHLDNFLVAEDGRLLAIDAGGYRVLGKPAGWRACVSNLGLLFAQFPLALFHAQAETLMVYAEARGLDGRRLIAATERSARRWRAWRARHLGKKAFRSSTEFLARRAGRLRIHQRRDLGLDQLDAWIRAGALAPGKDDILLKDGHSQTVWVTRLAGEEVVVKRYNPRSRARMLRRSLGRSRAARSWRAAHWLRALGIATPRPLAMVEERRGPFLARCWLITARARGEPAHRVVTAGSPPRQLRALAETVLAFGGNGLVHGDMKASNFILDGNRVEVIDLDSLGWPRLPGRLRRGRRADLERFLRNWEDDEALARRFRKLLGLPVADGREKTNRRPG